MQGEACMHYEDLIFRGGGCWGCGLSKRSTCSVGHISDCPGNLCVGKITSTLRRHGVLSFECRLNQCIQTRLDAWCPCSSICYFGCTGSTSCVAGCTLGLENLFAGLKWPVGIADFHAPHLLDAL